MKRSQLIMLAIKLIVTCALLWFVFRKVDAGPLAHRIASMHSAWLAASIITLFVQLLLTGLRWHFVGQMVDAGIRLGLAMRLILVGQFFNQVLPSSVGGDGVRAWLLSREGITIRHSFASVICDRVAALVMLTVIVACTFPIIISAYDLAIPSSKLLVILVDSVAVGGMLFLFFWGQAFSAWLISLSPVRPIGVIIRDLRRVLLLSRKSLWVIGLSIIVQMMIVICIYFCAQALEIKLGLVHLLMFPLIILVSSIPVSFAGWGLREGVMVTGLGFAGISAGDALAISVSFGIAQLLVGLPGAVVAVMTKYGIDSSGERPEIRSI